jgi:long-chain acyl-CoA synthetase
VTDAPAGEPAGEPPDEPPGERMTLDQADAQLTAPGQLFEIDEIEIRGVPTRVWKSAPRSLRTVLDLTLGYGDKDLLVYEDERTTFDEHYRAVATLAHRLRDDLRVDHGDRVAIAMRNLPEWSIAFWAVAVAGAVAVPLNAWWTGDELLYGLTDSGAVVAFVDEERAERIRAATGDRGDRGDLRTMIVVSEHRDRPPTVLADRPVHEIAFADVLGDVAPDAVPPDVDIQPDDDATIFYTSGTTGRPKGAVGTHRNTCTNLMNLFFVNTRGQLRYGKSALTDVSGKTQSAYLLTVPLFHATGCHAVLVTNTAAGGKLVMVHHFDPERVLDLIERERITTFGGVPTMVMQVLDSPDFARRDTSSIKSVSYGGAPAPPELVRRISDAFPGVQPGNGYGLTETTAITSMNTGADYLHKPDSVGPPMPVTDVAVVPDDYDGPEPTPDLPTGPDVTGELWVKGPQVVRGYWHRPDETTHVFTNGWLHTGDIARIDDDRFIYIVDRAKDVIIRGGENVYSVEVEAALFDHPAVADCAVIGVPHPTLGEEVGAVVVLRPGFKVTADELANHVRDRLPGFAVPTRFWFVDRPLPRNPAGKVLKRQLRTDLLGE